MANPFGQNYTNFTPPATPPAPAPVAGSQTPIQYTQGFSQPTAVTNTTTPAPADSAQSPFTFANGTSAPDKPVAAPNVGPVTKDPNGQVVSTTTGQAPQVSSGFQPAQSDPAYLQNFAQVQTMLMNSGWQGEDPNYWVGRIMQTGGFTPDNVGYWSHRIGLGPNGQTPDTPSTNNTLQNTITSSLSQGLPGSQTPLPANSANDLYTALMKRANQGLTVDPNDPIIKAQTNAYDTTQEQQRRKYMADLAEKGGPNADLGVENRSTSETAGQNDSQFQATLMANELTQRRTEIQNALTEQGSLLSDQQRIQLQQQLGLIDANLRQQGINSGNDQFAANFGLSAAEIAWLHNQIQSGGPTS